MRFNFLLSLFFSFLSIGGPVRAADPSGNAQKWDGRILDVRTQVSLGLDELAQRLIPVSNIVIGERHYSAAVQLAEGAIIRAAVRASGSEKAFTTAWEFLNFSDQEKTDRLFGQLVAGEIDTAQFLKLTQASAKAALYSPLIDATRELGGRLLGVNLSHEQKAPVVTGGLAALDPALLPPGFAMGGEGYFERFKVAMAGHANEENLHRYFEAECLTDDVMAFRFLENSTTAKKFLVAGSFHTEYFDATVARIKARLAAHPERPQGVATVRIFDASDYTEDELNGLLKDPKYGDVADFVFFVNEPYTGEDF